MKDDIISGFLVGVLGAVAALGVIDKLARMKAFDYASANSAYQEGQIDRLLREKQLASMSGEV